MKRKALKKVTAKKPINLQKIAQALHMAAEGAGGRGAPMLGFDDQNTEDAAGQKLDKKTLDKLKKEGKTAGVTARSNSNYAN